MNEFVVYILYSRAHGRTYIGFTSDLINRFHSHNHYSKKGFTAKYRPWEVAHAEFYTTRQEAMQRERWLKSGIGRDWIRTNVIF